MGADTDAAATAGTDPNVFPATLASAVPTCEPAARGSVSPDEPDDSHARLIPFVMLALFWWKRKELIALPLRTWTAGLILVGAAVLLGWLILAWVLSRVIGVHAIGQPQSAPPGCVLSVKSPVRVPQSTAVYALLSARRIAPSAAPSIRCAAIM